MDKLEEYVDQVCRRIGGPRTLRQHIRQELREHLGDAAAEHRAAGLSAEEALVRALDDFGKAEEVRSELEAAHGHRLMAVVIDKAIEWKEKTMKAKWLWASWAYLALVGVIALEVMFITFTVMFIVPRFQKLMRDGLVDPGILHDSEVRWMPSFLDGLKLYAGGYVTWILLATIVAWGLFEWRVRSENKAFIRLSALGTAAVGLMVVVILTAGSLVISFCLGLPATGRLARTFALDQISHIETSVRALEQARAKMDRNAMEDHALEASRSIDKLAKAEPALPALLASPEERMTVDELRKNVRAASEALKEVVNGVMGGREGQLDAALKSFHESFAPVQEAAKRPPR
jgi:hypothetical protein